jgi:hypothetical protein
MTMGIAVETGTPPATRPTIIEVTVVDDWISAVAKVPMINPAKGFAANSKSDLARSPAAVLNPVPIIETATSRI